MVTPIIQIDTFSNDILARVKSVTAYNNRVGFTVGNQKGDPVNENAQKPFAWIIFVGDELVEAAEPAPCTEEIKLNYIIQIVVEYGRDENNLIGVSLPLLHETAQAIRGGEPVQSSWWLYEGQDIIEHKNERIVFAQRYSITVTI